MKEIKKIASSAFSRNIKFAKLALGSGRALLSSKDKNIKDILSSAVSGQAHKIVNELGLMKGSAQKIGQILSLYSEAFLSKDMQAVLRQLENQSFYLSWDEIKKNIPTEFFTEIDFEEKPIAAASLGQVHRAIRKEDGVDLAVKIQYRGVKKAIENDIKTLKLFLKFFDLLPSNQDYSLIFEEVRSMLHQETDYLTEMQNQIEFKRLLADDTNFYVADVDARYTTEKLLTQEFIVGVNPRDWVKDHFNASQSKSLSISFFDLFFREVFLWKMVQSDPHPGNYLIQNLEDGSVRWALLDFGATKKLDSALQDLYKNFIKSAVEQDKDLFVHSLEEGGFIQKGYNGDYQLLWDYLNCLGEPFQVSSYDWGASTTADQIIHLVPKIIRTFANNQPPGETIFIDRKIGGVYFILKLLRANFSAREISDRYL